MNLFSSQDEEKPNPPRLGGGPLGLGDPNDRRLRKTERDIILSKMLREEAAKKCSDTLKEMLQCAEQNGLMEVFNCKEVNQKHIDCMAAYVRNSEFVEEVTEKYLKARSHYRQTGEPLVKYDPFKGRKNRTEVS